MNTRIEYLYRDGSNYKRFQSVAVEGKLTDEEMEEIFCCCEDGTYFVPEAVGLPADRLDEYERNEDDHMTLELIGIEETDESATEYVSAKIVLARFREIGPDGWGRFV